MKMLYLSILLLFLFLSSEALGYFITRKGNKEFSFFTHFPFELKNRDERLTLSFRVSLVLVGCLATFISFYCLFINAKYALEKNLALLLVLNAILYIALHVIDTRKYKVHLVTSILFMVVNLGSYFLLFYLPIRDNFYFYHVTTLVLGVIIFIVLMVLTLLPSLKKWYVMEVDESGTKSRGKIFPLAFIEWINILSYFLLFIILMINYMIYTL